jgi:radical SAM superfamily enzyme
MFCVDAKCAKVRLGGKLPQVSYIGDQTNVFVLAYVLHRLAENAKIKTHIDMWCLRKVDIITDTIYLIRTCYSSA